MPGFRKASEARFRARVAELGGTILEPAWLGSHTRHRVLCPAGHECTPRPHDVMRGKGLCRACAGKDPATAEAKFRVRVAELGGTIVEPLVWWGGGEHYRVICAAGHECAPIANGVANQGHGLCSICARNDPVTAEANFRARIAELGGTLLEPVYLGSAVPHRVRCAKGHVTTPCPASVAYGRGVCRVCAGNDPATAEAKFRARVAELGGTIVEPLVWRGNHEHYRVICAAGHECAPIASGVANRGEGLCRICTGLDPAVSEANFRARVIELGGTLLEPVYLGSAVPHRVRCARGHVTTPRPGAVAYGQGICRACAGKVWDRFYVVTNPDRARLKFGITSATARRLVDHRSNGYKTVIRFLSVADADSLERNTLLTLRLANVDPVKGREYFDLSALPLVLDVADNWLGAAVVQP